MSDVSRKRFHARELNLISNAPPPDEPPLYVGDRCRLNSGGHDLLVVDADKDAVIVAWRKGVCIKEHLLPRACVRRVLEAK